jgi:hypothetical protein
MFSCQSASQADAERNCEWDLCCGYKIYGVLETGSCTISRNSTWSPRAFLLPRCICRNIYMKLLLASHMRLFEYGNKYIRLFKEAIKPESANTKARYWTLLGKLCLPPVFLTYFFQESCLNPLESSWAIDLISVEYIVSVPESVVCHWWWKWMLQTVWFHSSNRFMSWIHTLHCYSKQCQTTT